MASSVGCWTSSSKVGRSGFSLSFIIKLCEDVLRLIRLYINLSSVLLDCIFARVSVFYRSYTTITYRCISTRFCGFSGFLHLVHQRPGMRRSPDASRRFSSTLLSCVRTRANLQLHSPSSHCFSFFNYRRLSAIFGRRCAAVVGEPDAFWPVVAVSSAGKGRVRLSRWLVTLEPKTSALEVT